MDVNYNWSEDWEKIIPKNLIGAKHTFSDNDSIEIIAVKLRDFDEGISPFITYLIQQGPGIPRKLVMEFNEFIRTYGHLFPEVFK
jgi:hypothetical protein